MKGPKLGRSMGRDHSVTPNLPFSDPPSGFPPSDAQSGRSPHLGPPSTSEHKLPPLSRRATRLHLPPHLPLLSSPTCRHLSKSFVDPLSSKASFCVSNETGVKGPPVERDSPLSESFRYYHAFGGYGDGTRPGLGLGSGLSLSLGKRPHPRRPFPLFALDKKRRGWGGKGILQYFIA